MKTKVVDLDTLNNFYKGYIGFFFTEFELHECQLECQSDFANSESCLATNFSSLSSQNLKCQST
jgi:hypothetical protein